MTCRMSEAPRRLIRFVSMLEGYRLTGELKSEIPADPRLFFHS